MVVLHAPRAVRAGGDDDACSRWRPALLVPDRVSAYTLDGDGELRRDRRMDIDYGPLYSDLGMTVADFARWLATLDRGRPLTAASVAAMTAPRRLADGGFGWRAVPVEPLRAGRRARRRFSASRSSSTPATAASASCASRGRKLAVAVFTNLEHPAGSDPVGLALGVAGRLEPALASPRGGRYRRRPRSPSSRPRTTSPRRFAGARALRRAAAEAAWEGAAGLAGRAPRLGEARAPTSSASARSKASGRSWRGPSTSAARSTCVPRSTRRAKIARLVWWHV